MLDAVTHALSRLVDVCAAAASELTAIALRSLHQHSMAMLGRPSATGRMGRDECSLKEPGTILPDLVAWAEALLLQLNSELCSFADTLVNIASQAMSLLNFQHDSVSITPLADESSRGSLDASDTALHARYSRLHGDLLQLRKQATESFTCNLHRVVRFGEALMANLLLRARPLDATPASSCDLPGPMHGHLNRMPFCQNTSSDTTPMLRDSLPAQGVCSPLRPPTDVCAPVAQTCMNDSGATICKVNHAVAHATEVPSLPSDALAPRLKGGTYVYGDTWFNHGDPLLSAESKHTPATLDSSHALSHAGGAVLDEGPDSARNNNETQCSLANDGDSAARKLQWDTVELNAIPIDPFYSQHTDQDLIEGGKQLPTQVFMSNETNVDGKAKSLTYSTEIDAPHRATSSAVDDMLAFLDNAAMQVGLEPTQADP